LTLASTFGAWTGSGSIRTRPACKGTVFGYLALRPIEPTSSEYNDGDYKPDGSDAIVSRD
jgi:hypothetical protein